MALVVKNPPANARDIRECGFEKILWITEYQPTTGFLPAEPMEGDRVYSVANSQT